MRSTTPPTNKAILQAIRTAERPILLCVREVWAIPSPDAQAILDRVGAGLAPFVELLEIAADRHRTIATRFNVTQYPSFILFKRGKRVAARLGLTSEEHFTGWLTAKLVTIHLRAEKNNAEILPRRPDWMNPLLIGG